MANNLKKISVYFLFFFTLSFLFVEKVSAVCPVCTLAVGAGVGLSRWLGIDDSVTGLWIGGLIVSMITWTESWLDKKNIRFKGRIFFTTLAYYAVIIIPLYYSGIIGHPQNALFYFRSFKIDKLLFGIVAGSIAFLSGASWYFYLKEKNKGRAYFPFQKVVMPVAPLVVLSAIFYFLTK